MKRGALSVVALVMTLAAVALLAQNKDVWRAHVSAADKARSNPFAQDSDAKQAGARLYEMHCARCHGAQAQGIRNKPALTGADVQQATDGELFWLLRNGEIGKGMPAWTTLPEAQCWQLIAYIRSLPTTTPTPTKTEP